MVTSLLFLIATAIIIEPQLCVRSYSCIHGVYYLWWKVCLFNNMNTSWEYIHICRYVMYVCSVMLMFFISYPFLILFCILCNMVKHITKYEFVSFIPWYITYISFSFHFSIHSFSFFMKNNSFYFSTHKTTMTTTIPLDELFSPHCVPFIELSSILRCISMP